MQATRWALMGLIGLLIARCASPTPTIAPTHTSVPTVTPMLGQTQGTALPPTSTIATTLTRPAPTVIPTEVASGVTITILYDNNEELERPRRIGALEATLCIDPEPPEDAKRRLIGVARHAALVNTLTHPPEVTIRFAGE